MAEMTGRRGRIVGDGRGRGVFTLRALTDSQEMDSLNVAEKGLLPASSCFPTPRASRQFLEQVDQGASLGSVLA